MSVKLANVIFIFCLAISLVSSAEELPQIEMPDVVISGVERATVIRADRLQYGKNEVRVNLAEGLLTNRPEIQSQSISIFPKRPVYKDISNYNRVVLEAGAGSFGNFSGSVQGSFPLAFLSGDAKADLDIPPQRIQAGDDYLGGGKISFAHKAPGQSLIQYKFGITANQFTLNNSAHSERRWTDFLGDVNVTPIFTPIGSFSAGFHYDGWNNEGAGSFDGDLYSAYFRHYTDLGDWQIITMLDGFWEQLPGNYQELGVSSGSLAIAFKPLPNIHLTTGVFSYRGYSHTFGNQDGVDAVVKLNWNPQANTSVKLSWEPDYEVFSARHAGEIYPMITTNTWGNISEDYTRLKFSVEKYLSNNSKVFVKGLYADSPHYPLPLQEFNAEWSMATTRLKMTEVELGCDYQIIRPLSLGMSGGLVNADAENPNINQTAPQFAPYFGNIVFRWLENDIWATACFRWEDGFPVALLDDRTAPSHWESEFSVGYTFAERMQAFLTVTNLVNSHFEAISGYDSAPLSIRAGITYGIDSSAWKWRNTVKNLNTI